MRFHIDQCSALGYSPTMKPLGGKGESPFLRVRVPSEMLEALRRLAARDRRKLSDYVRLLIEDHLAMKRKRGSP